ncbi:MAG: FAD-dependent oxidoreductase [Opitutales bacterium]
MIQPKQVAAWSAPRELETDVVVVGGGSAGSAAALAAARNGASVVLIEEGNCLGGVSTAGGVNEWFANLEGIGDIMTEVVGQMEAAGAKYGRFFNGEMLKFVWQELLSQAGVTLLFHTSLTGTVLDGRRITAVEALSLSRPVRIAGRWFIDASGEGDLAAAAGAAFHSGDPENGKQLHMSLTGLMVKSPRKVEPWLPDHLEPIAGPDDVPGLKTAYRTPDGRVYVNMTKIMSRDSTDPIDVSAAEAEARRQLLRSVHYLQRTRFPNHILVSSGARIGIREGRRIVGETTLTRAYILREDGQDGRCPDPATVATCQVDFHSLSRAGHAGWREAVAPYQVPFGALVVAGIDNLLTAGKCISSDQIAHSSVRMTPTCTSMGQAAGIAAGLVAAGGAETFRTLPYRDLQAALTRQGFDLEPTHHQSFAPEVTSDSEADRL